MLEILIIVAVMYIASIYIIKFSLILNCSIRVQIHKILKKEYNYGLVNANGTINCSETINESITKDGYYFKRKDLIKEKELLIRPITYLLLMPFINTILATLLLSITILNKLHLLFLKLK